jgi:hypothetical protein
MAILIVPSKSLLDELIFTPNLDGEGSVKMGMPVELADGRFAVIHPWQEVSVDWLTAYVQGIAGAEVLEANSLPYPVKERIIKHE